MNRPQRPDVEVERAARVFAGEGIVPRRREVTGRFPRLGTHRATKVMERVRAVLLAEMDEEVVPDAVIAIPPVHVEEPAPMRYSDHILAVAGETVTPVAAPHRAADERGRGESSLSHIALSVRDAVKSGVMTEDAVMARYALTRAQVYSVFGAVLSGVLDGLTVPDREALPVSESAAPGDVVVPWRGNVLVIGDTHIPFEHPGYLDFCRRQQDRWKCEVVCHAGDEIDAHALSYHESDPDGFSAGHEAEMAVQRLRRWYAAFPLVSVMVGNHSALPFRKAYTHGIPKRMMRTYEELWQAPAGWKWMLSLVMETEPGVSDVRLLHGTGKSGANAAMGWAMAIRTSAVIGHVHSQGGVRYQTNGRDMIFGLNVGCGVDIGSYAAAYGKNYADKPTLGCGVVLDGGREAHFIPMPH